MEKICAIFRGLRNKWRSDRRCTQESTSMEKDVKDDLDDFIYQAAGHQYINGFRTFLKCNDGTLLKIFQDGNRGHREMEFYSEIFSANHDSDQTASALRHFMPTYFGTVTIKNDKNSQPYMKISDVTSKFKRPCVIDLKIGRRTYDPLATEAKRARAVDKYPLQDQIGFRIDGMKVYNSDTGNYDDYDKIFGRKLDDDTIVNAQGAHTERFKLSDTICYTIIPFMD
ncbi:uncharacterized protein TRIADDRAFT_55735 [Trichoplax adhaerens]|uniref:Kinase n=1 Tax=Trichoplax adhaerens TaxID=10228 RepID=B3RVQ3_TRIAD|nr:hypothetical protein TRIADDRAFT_55735 [Trichoplax adhaerens]EDV26035.1 hypothetical protein TRIADDRAFT_55735 [Trichoplax adhaerens]|eukprot:XP_002112068.1 hypothetical protein TRIADDRAFT_55735 [Trichoplax adhaerens]